MTQPTPPGKPLGMTDFFALEAGEYLERLDAVLQPAEGTAPLADESVRLARALRGSARMAGQPATARAAAGLESLARAIREGRRPWEPGVKQMAVRAVDDLKIFVRRVAAWTDADTAKAEALALQLEQMAGRPSAQVRAAEALGLDAGARAFVAREGAAIASALDRAAKALRANPLAHDPLQHILKALQPLRGLAALNDLPPLPDLLEGIERSIGELERARASSAPTPDGPDLFQQAAAAIARAAREVAERGRPDPESAEFRSFAGVLVKFLEADQGEGGVVPIGALYFDDSGPHIVRRGTSAARPAVLGRVELVSHGEHLKQVADSLERAPSQTQRELRAHTLAGTFRALAGAGGGPLAERVAELALAGRAAGGRARASRRGHPHAALPRPARAAARPGAAPGSPDGLRRAPARARRRGLRPRCPRHRARVAAPPAGPGSSAWRSPPACSRGRCTTYSRARSSRTRGARIRGSSSRPSPSRRSPSRSAPGAGR